MKVSRETIKMKTPVGEVKVAVLGDSPGAEEYLQHINNFIQMLMLGRKKIEEDMLKLAKADISYYKLKSPSEKVQNRTSGREAR